jgi:hypothetical protein
VSSVGYKVDTSAQVALTAATPRTALMVLTPAQFGCALTKVTIAFEGVTAADEPVFWEVVRSTNASNSTPGTNNTNENANILQTRGRALTAGFTAFSASTSEPTVLTRLDGGLLTPSGGLAVLAYELGKELECDLSAGLGVRLTAPDNVDAWVGVHFERI